MTVKWIVTIQVCIQMVCCLLYNSKDGVKIKYSLNFGKVCGSEEDRFAIFYGLSIGECVRECGLRKHCKALTLQRQLNVCELFSSDVGFDGHHECIRVLSKDIAINKYPCNDCAYGKVCDTTSKRCLVKECVSLEPLDHGTILGNMRNVGSKIHFKCDDGYNLGNGTSFAECTASGAWNVTTVCVKANIGCYFAGQSHLFEGTRQTTINGRNCQRWESQSPHTHDRNNPDTFPYGDVSASENYCRDPDYYGEPWCYTTDPDVRWESCGIPVC